jgi:peroxiredoxin Q/BCP
MTDSASATSEATPQPAPAEGAPAPDFALPDDRGLLHRLADRQGGWTVVYFYPEDDTPGCTTEACQFRDLSTEFDDLDAEVWGISPDGSGSHASFRAKFGLPFTLLSDEDHAVAERYGAWTLKNNYGRTYWGIQRSTFLVDPSGVVARAWPRVKADGHADAVLAALREARAPAAS